MISAKAGPKTSPKASGPLLGKTQADHGRFAAADTETVVGRRFGACPGRVDRLRLAGDDAIVDAILDIGRWIGGVKETLVVGLVLGEQQGGRALAIEEVIAEFAVRSNEGVIAAT